MLAGNIDVLQKRLGVPTSKKWDTVTRGALTAYQQSKGAALPMQPSGHPDPATLINLGYYDPLDSLPHAQIAYLEGGAKPGHFGRDLATVISQVPRWAWFTLGGALVAMAYVSYRGGKKAAAA